jgi:hypothetical protein
MQAIFLGEIYLLNFFIMLLLAGISGFGKMVEVTLREVESGWFFDFGIFEFVEGVTNAILEEVLEVIEPDGFGVVFEFDLRVEFIDRIEGLGVLVEVGEGDGGTVGVVELEIVEVEGVEGVFFEVVGEVGELTVVIDGVHRV